MCHSQEQDFDTVELRVSEGIKWGFLPEQITTSVAGRVGQKNATESSTFAEGSVTASIAVNEKVQLFVSGIGGTSTTDGTEDVFGFQAGVRSSF